jgi:hypothetical protein
LEYALLTRTSLSFGVGVGTSSNFRDSTPFVPCTVHCFVFAGILVVMIESQLLERLEQFKHYATSMSLRLCY